MRGAWGRVDNEAACLAAALAEQEDPVGSVSAEQTEMEIPAKAKPFIEVEAVAVNAESTVEIEASSGIARGDTYSP